MKQTLTFEGGSSSAKGEGRRSSGRQLRRGSSAAVCAAPRSPVPMAAPSAEASAFAEKFLGYIDNTPTPFHLCAVTGARLLAAGFTELNEDEPWASAGQIVAGGKYFYTRNQSTLVAFVVGGAYTAGGGFKVVGAHTDSPVLKVKPVSKKVDKASGLLQLGVECYGGGLWHTWFDRDLSIAGSVIVKTEGGGFERRLLHCKKPFMRVPNLCIHLQSPDERSKFIVNKETHLVPILGIDMEIFAEQQVNAVADGRHSPAFLLKLAKELGARLHQQIPGNPARDSMGTGDFSFSTD